MTTCLAAVTIRDEKYQAARVLYHESAKVLVNTARALVPDIVRSFDPEILSIDIEGTYNEDGDVRITLHAANGGSGLADSAWDVLSDALEEPFGYLGDLASNEYVGHHTIEFPT